MTLKIGEKGKAWEKKADGRVRQEQAEKQAEQSIERYLAPLRQLNREPSIEVAGGIICDSHRVMIGDETYNNGCAANASDFTTDWTHRVSENSLEESRAHDHSRGLVHPDTQRAQFPRVKVHVQ